MTRIPAKPIRRRFTLVEMLVVLAIIGVIVGLVLPNVGKLPEGLRADSCAGTIGNAFRDAALRARATGATVKLTLDAENNRFRLEEAAAAVQAPAGDVSVSAAAAGDEAQASRGRYYAGEKEYPLPNGIEWHLENWDAAVYGPPAFTFYANGECSGLRLEFSAGSRRLRLEVDRLTGNPVITDVEG